MNQTNQNKFTKTYESVMSVHEVKALDGSTVNLTLVLKVVWQYMYGKYQYYNSLGNDYYENISDISKNSGVAVRSINRSISTLQSIGAVTVSKKKINGFIYSNCYQVQDPVSFISTINLTSDHFYELDSDEPFL